MPENLDVYMVTDKAVGAGQNCLNVYFYQVNAIGIPGGADVMLDSFEGQVLPAVLACQTSDIIHTELTAQNLFNPTDREVRAISEAGVRGSADDMPVFTAIGVKLNQDNGAIRNGSKRYVGLVEGDQTSGVITGTTLLNALDDLMPVLAEKLLVGVSEVFTPVIVKRLLVGGDYVLPTSLEDLVVGVVVEAVYSLLETTQNSRKVGVGE